MRSAGARGWDPFEIGSHANSIVTDVRSIHIIGTRILGGAERFLARLVNALTEDDYRSMAVVRPGSPLPDLLNGEVPVECVAMRNGVDVFSMRAIRKLTGRLKPQAVQTYMGRATRITRLPRSVPTVHVARLGGYYRLASYRHADALVGNTRGICRYLREQGVDGQRVFHIGNFVEEPGRPAPDSTPAEVRRGLGFPEDAWLVFALGRFVTKKGFHILLEAFSALPDRVDGRPVHLVVAGDGPLAEDLRRRADQMGLAPRLHWLGWVAEPGPYLAASDVFVCPSLDEPLGNVVLEAWSRSVPVVSTATAGPSELISPGNDGILVETGSASGLRDGVLRVLEESAEFRAGLARAGRQTLLARHSQAAVVAAYRRLYATVTRRKRG